MKRVLVIILFAMGLNACSSMHTLQGGLFYRQEQEKKLAAAIKLQNEGKISSAVEAFIAICAKRGVSGVTDEALFRLTLLYLGSGLDNDRDSMQLAQQNIERLRREYPSSAWTGMIDPVAQLLATASDQRRQNQSCKTQNQALSRENQSLSREAQELRQTIEKLKRLDLELEQKRK